MIKKTTIRSLQLGHRYKDKGKGKGYNEHIKLPKENNAINKELSFERLSSKNNPWDFIESSEWKDWQRIIEKDFASLPIWTIATQINCRWPWSGSKEVVGKYIHLNLDNLRKQPTFGRNKTRTYILCVAAVVLGIFKLDKEEVDVQASEIELHEDKRNPKIILFEMLKELSDQERDILLRRSCFTKDKMTLEEIGGLYDVTRERVRQIESKALKKLKRSPHLQALARSIENYKLQIFQSIMNPDGFIFKEDIRSVLATYLDGTLLFAFDICFKDLSEWFSTCFSNNLVEVGDTYLITSYSKEEVLSTIDKLSPLFKSSVLPVPLCVVTNELGVSNEVVKVATIALGNFSVFDRFITNIPINTYTKRAIRLYNLFLYHQATDPLSMLRIIRTYRKRHPLDKFGNDRLIGQAMESAPHLFIKLGNKFWYSNTFHGNEVFDEECDQSVESEYEDQQDEINENPGKGEEATGIKGVLYEIFKENSLVRINEVRERFKKLSKGKYSLSSCGVILTTHSDFVRMAPGVYGLYNENKNIDPIFNSSPILLDEKSLKDYATARYAGEPIEAYPLWTHGMEKAWCEWGEHAVSIEIFKSLLYVIEPEKWHCTEEVRNYWKRLKVNLGDYLLSTPPCSVLSSSPPELLDILKVARYASVERKINWISINRLIGKTINDHGAASVLAILIGLNVISAELHWQRPHNVRQEIMRLVESLSDELFYKGVLTWRDGVGKNLLDKLGLSLSHSLGWVSRAELSSLVAVLNDEKIDIALPSTGNNELDEFLELL